MEKYLLPGETVLMEQAGNAQFGLDRTYQPEVLRTVANETDLFVMSAKALGGTAQALWKLATEFKGAIAGRVYLTNYRLFFQSRGINLFSGAYGIFLRTITADSNDKGWISDQLRVRTRAMEYFFAIRHGKELVAELEKALVQCRDDARLIQQVLTHFDKAVPDVPGIVATYPDAMQAIAAAERAVQTDKLNLLQLSALANAISLLHDG
jgi:hypothetical protein